MIDFKWNNMASTLKDLKEIEQEYPKAVQAALLDRAEAVMDRAVELAPKRTGRLARSAYIAVRGQGHVEVGFGARHAMEVHERLEVSHANGQAKFLEQALIDEARGKMFLVAKQARKYAKSGKAPMSTKYPRTPR